MSNNELSNNPLNPQNFTEDLFIVGIGASTGGVRALEEFFSHLPQNSGAAFVVIQQLSSRVRTLMTELLQRQTPMPVYQIGDQMALAPNSVYYLSSENNLIVEDKKLRVLEKSSERSNFPINIFFQSLAKEYGERSMGVLLSGTGQDGKEGLQAIGKAGGIALIQSTETAQFNIIPENALPKGLADEILSPQDLAQTIYDLIRLSVTSSSSEPLEENSIEPSKLKQVLGLLTEYEHIDFSQYKVSTLSRRIYRRCAIVRSQNLENYIRFLEDSEQERKQLRQDLLIGATRFFRDPEAWHYLESEVIPSLLDQLQPQQQLRIWVAACATGEEAYSLAMLIDEVIEKRNLSINVKIFATDLDRHALEVASKGIYPESIANEIAPERLAKYFTYKPNCFSVNRQLRKMLIFAPHDLTKNVGFSRMNLISCRNVLIYMQPQLQRQILRLLHFSLAPQGILFLGSAEVLGEFESEFLPIERKWKIYQKRRELQPSFFPLERQTLLPPITTSAKFNKNQPRFDRLLNEVFKFCFADRPATCVLVNQENKLVYIFYNTANLLQFPVGQTNWEVTTLVPPPLQLPLRTALQRATREGQSVLYAGIKVGKGDELQTINLRVGYYGNNSTQEKFLIVVLEQEKQPQSNPSADRFEADAEAAQQILELESELQQTRENLQATIEELETANEEHQATNEELLASNEELQSTNEELHSLNEELYTVNAEYQSKIEELTELNNDMDNLLQSTAIGVVFLNRELKIRKFTAAATAVINLREGDINRPLQHLSHNLDVPNLFEVLQQVLESQQATEQEVTLGTTGNCLLMRVNLYRKDNGDCDGLVLTFVNINEIKRVQTELEYLYATTPVGLCMMDENLRFLRVNQVLAQMNGLSVQEHLGKTIREVIPELADQVEFHFRQAIGTGKPLRNMEISGHTPAEPNQERYWIGSYYPMDLPEGSRVYGAAFVEITELKKVQAALRESQERLNEAQRIAHIGSWELDVKTQKMTWSDEMFRIYGLNPVQREPTYPEYLQRIHPVDRVIHQSMVEQAIALGIPYQFDLRFFRPDGSLGYAEARGERVLNSKGQVVKLIGTVIDITARKQAEQKIGEQAALLNVATDAIIVRDLNNQVLFWNQGAERLYGFLPDEAIGKSCSELWSETTPSQLELAKNQVIQRGEWRGEFERTTKSGQKIIVESHWSLVRDEVGTAKAILTVDTDVTEKKQLEIQFLRAQRLESIGNVAGSLAHDLNNILNPIVGIAQLLPRKFSDIDEHTKQLLNILESNAKHGAALVQQVLSFARGAELKPIVMQIRDLLEQIQQTARGTFPESIEISIELPLDPWPIHGDTTQLHQVFMNLVVNARDAMPEGGTLKLSATNILLDENFARTNLDARVGAYVAIAVVDTGMGIAPEILERIFEPFFTTKAVGRGTGLGLASVANIVKSHGGFIKVSSQVGEGTQFQVFLPALQEGSPSE